MRRCSAMVFAVVLSACGGGQEQGPSGPNVPETIRVTSAAFDEGATIPSEYTCDGPDVSPPIDWSTTEGDRTALVLTDPDAPGGEFVHWIVYLQGGRGGLTEGAVPPDATEGRNSFGRTGYGGPCPPEADSPHRYVFTVYAVAEDFSLPAPEADPAEAVDAIRSAAVAFGSLSARYGR